MWSWRVCCESARKAYACPRTAHSFYTSYTHPVPYTRVRPTRTLQLHSRTQHLATPFPTTTATTLPHKVSPTSSPRHLHTLHTPSTHGPVCIQRPHTRTDVHSTLCRPPSSSPCLLHSSPPSVPSFSLHTRPSSTPLRTTHSAGRACSTQDVQNPVWMTRRGENWEGADGRCLHLHYKTHTRVRVLLPRVSDTWCTQ